MARLATLTVALLLLAGCATHHDPKPAVCDGKHRRPANPYGSVLPNAPLPADPKATLGPLSAIDPRSFQPCERPA